jgi:hypothetical protein
MDMSDLMAAIRAFMVEGRGLPLHSTAIRVRARLS